MTKTKLTKIPNRSGWSASKTLLVGLALLTTSTAASKVVSRVENLTLSASSTNEGESGLYSGSLSQKILTEENKRILVFDFKVVKTKEKNAFKKSYRITAEVEIDPEKVGLGGPIYKDNYTQNSLGRFSVRLYKNSEGFSSPKVIKPNKLIENLKIKKFSFEAELTQNNSGVELLELNLELNGTNNQEKFKFEYFRRKNQKAEFEEEFWPW